jgi:hypothetical protein
MPCERRHSDHVFGVCHLERTLSPPGVVAPGGFSFAMLCAIDEDE